MGSGEPKHYHALTLHLIYRWLREYRCCAVNHAGSAP
jgi:hypothetical protein